MNKLVRNKVVQEKTSYKKNCFYVCYKEKQRKISLQIGTHASPLEYKRLK